MSDPTLRSVLSPYEMQSIAIFNELKELKLQRRRIDGQIKETENKLTQALAHGDLVLWQDNENKNTFYYEDTSYTFCAGRVKYDYSLCEDVVAAEANLQEVKSMAAATGLVQQSHGKPFWTVR